MPLDTPGGIAGDGLAESDQFDRLDIERSLLADLADDGLLQRLAKLDAAARQRIDAFGRRPAARHDEHFAVAEDRGADRQDRPRGISPTVGRLRHYSRARFALYGLSYVRTLCHHLDAGGDPKAVRLSRTAEFPAALQCGADPADPDRTACQRPALLRADALGLSPGLGQGSQK